MPVTVILKSLEISKFNIGLSVRYNFNIVHLSTLQMKMFEEIVYSNVKHYYLQMLPILFPFEKNNNCGFLKFFSNSGLLKLVQYLKRKVLIKSANFYVYP